MAGTTAFDISPGEYASSGASGGNVYFAPVNFGTKSETENYLKYAAIIVVVFAVVIVATKRRR